MSAPGGQLQIRLRRVAGRWRVTMDSSRPVTASRLFVGKPVADTVTGLPRLFQVCAMAQAAACAAACEQALGLLPSPETQWRRARMVDAEIVREHLWRLLLDWPRVRAALPESRAMAEVIALAGRLQAALAQGADPWVPGASGGEPDRETANTCLAGLLRQSALQVFGQAPGPWLEQTASAAGLAAWRRESQAPAAALLRRLESRGWAAHGACRMPGLPAVLATEELAACLDSPRADEFVARPLWHGAPAESSPYSRNRHHPLVAELTARHGNGLVPRLAAQLVDLASRLVALRQGLEHGPPAGTTALSRGSKMAPGTGLAQIQAARGLLVHQVVLEGERVADYRILAPTEWNFHPRGVVARGLERLPANWDGEPLNYLAGLFILAVDPCVDYQVILD